MVTRILRRVLSALLLLTWSGTVAGAERPAPLLAPANPARGIRGSRPAETIGPPGVGVLLPLSGRYQRFGESCLRGIRVSLGALEDRTPVVRTVIIDTHGEPLEAASAYQKLAADPGIVAVLGPMLSPELDAVRRYALGFDLATVHFSQRPLPVGGPLFRFSMTKEDQAQVLARYAVGELGLRRWAIFHPDDAYGRQISSDFRLAVEGLGARVVADVDYPPEKADLQAEAKRLQAKVGASENEPPAIDGVFLPETAERLGMVTSYLAFVDIRGVQLLGASGWDRPQELLAAMPNVNRGIFVDGFFLYSFRPEVRAFVNAYRDAYHDDPGTLEAYGYDAASLVRDLIAAGSVTRGALLGALRRPFSLRGATGETIVAPGGRIEKGLFLLRIEDGTIREIETPTKTATLDAAAPRERGALSRPSSGSPSMDGGRRW
jgi:ABC-type branched-subunit amino acid transport system substrate-binding protein